MQTKAQVLQFPTGRSCLLKLSFRPLPVLTVGQHLMSVSCPFLPSMPLLRRFPLPGLLFSVLLAGTPASCLAIFTPLPSKPELEVSYCPEHLWGVTTIFWGRGGTAGTNQSEWVMSQLIRKSTCPTHSWHRSRHLSAVQWGWFREASFEPCLYTY